MSPGYKEPPSTPTYKRRLNRAEGVSLGPVGEEQTFTMDETVCQRACRIPIGRAYDDDQVLAMARMSVRYPDADTLLQEELPLRKGEDDLLFSEVAATYIVLHIIPLYSSYISCIKPKIISFDVQALAVFLSPRDRDVDAALKSGFKRSNELLKEIVQLLHYYRTIEMSKCGIEEYVYRLGMTGVASIPVEKPVDVYDSDSDSEEAAGVSTMDIVNEISLDIIYDVAKAEFDAAKEIAEDERITIFMLRSSSVVAIQRIVRGNGTRNKNILEVKRTLKKDLKNRANFGALAIQTQIRIYLAKSHVRITRVELAQRKQQEKLRQEETEKALKWAAEMGINMEGGDEGDNGNGNDNESDLNKDKVGYNDNEGYEMDGEGKGGVGGGGFIPPGGVGGEGVDARTKWMNAYGSNPSSPARPTVGGADDNTDAKYAKYNKDGDGKFESPTPSPPPTKHSKHPKKELKLPKRVDICDCHDVRCHKYCTELKDTQMEIYGLYSCGGVCEHGTKEEKFATKNMYNGNEPNSMIVVMSRGDGHWRMRVTVCEILSEEEKADLLEVEEENNNGNNGNSGDTNSALLRYQSEVVIEGEELTQLALNYAEELRRLRQQESDSDSEAEEEETGTSRSGGRSRGKGEKEGEREGEEDPLMVLHACMTDDSRRSEIFRRACAGITVSWRYDSSLQAEFDLQTVLDEYEIFSDDDGDLVVGI